MRVYQFSARIATLRLRIVADGRHLDILNVFFGIFYDWENRKDIRRRCEAIVVSLRPDRKRGAFDALRRRVVRHFRIPHDDE